MKKAIITAMIFLFILPAPVFAGGIVYDAQGNAYVDPGGGSPLIDIHSGPRAAQQEMQRQQMEQQQYRMEEQRLDQQRRQQMQRAESQRRQPGPSKVIEFDGDGYKSQYGD